MKLLLTLFALLLVPSLVPSLASANLQVFPTRLVLSDSQRSGQLSMRLNGSKSERYQISAVFYRMNADASLELVANPGDNERSAKSMIRFSPRVVELTPNVEQIVRVMKFSGKPLEEGEYRAHLFFEPLPADPEKNEGSSNEKVTMQLQARIAIAIPIVIRQGNPVVTGSLANLKIVPPSPKTGKHSFEVDLSKTGPGFLYGDFELSFTPKGGTKPTSVATITGVSSYIDKRPVRYSFDPPSGLDLKAGTFRLDFRKPAESGGSLISSIEKPID